MKSGATLGGNWGRVETKYVTILIREATVGGTKTPVFGSRVKPVFGSAILKAPGTLNNRGSPPASVSTPPPPTAVTVTTAAPLLFSSNNTSPTFVPTTGSTKFFPAGGATAF